MVDAHHAEWLSLLDISGPFLSPPVLDRVFPQGLEAADSDHTAKLRLAYEEWAEEQQLAEPDPAIHDAWIRFIFGETLGLTPEVLLEGEGIPEELEFTSPEHGETIRPDFVVFDPEDEPGTRKPRLLISVWPAGTELGQPVDDARWTASPIDRMIALCRSEQVGLRLGLVTNGEQWALVDAPVGETSAHGSWYANLWGPEPLTLRAFRSLLGLRRFFGVAENDRLDAMLVESANYQTEVTDQLGFQVRRAVEVLVQAIDRADADTGRTLLADTDPARIYEAALTVMMRLVFLFSAEERGLLRLGDPMYDQFYAVSTLHAQLQEAADQVGPEVLERRQDAWSRLLGTFRAIYGGVHHQDLQIIPYGSSLFDPDRFPFLEGRSDDTTWRDTDSLPMAIDNRTVLLLLRSLQMLDLGKGKGARKLSFRALDIEQIGHVYETLLDHSAYRASEPMVSLQGNQGREPEIPVSKLIELILQENDDPLVDFLEADLKKGGNSVRKILAETAEPEFVARLRTACGGDDVLLGKVLPFHGLIRLDPWGNPVIIGEGSVFVTAGETRRSTGTHYTPQAFTEEIVQHALEPLVYRGPAAGRPRDEWKLKPPAEILGLKVCDPAMGSGAFLVQAARYLSERLVESWELAGQTSVEAACVESIPADAEERLSLARRLVADRCLYGVDVNPLAVEMAKLSLWLVTLAKDRPFSFVDHALKCGDSLLGVHSSDQVTHFSLNPEEASRVDEGTLFADFSSLNAAIEDAAETRYRLAAIRELDIIDVQQKAALLFAADKAVARARYVGDAISALEIARAKYAHGAYLDKRVALADRVRARIIDAEFAARPDQMVQSDLDIDVPDDKPSRCPFHWPLEFPEVFERGGFDAMVANPPFLGGKRISGAFGSAYREYLTRSLGRDVRGNADLSAFFVLRMAQLTKTEGFLCTLATNTIGQGDTRKVGLDQLIAGGFSLYRADPTRSWPGAAAVEVALVGLTRVPFAAPLLSGRDVSAIGSDLAIPLSIEGRPHRLAENMGIAFQGTIVLGKGFMLDPSVARMLMDTEPENRSVLKPYVNGKDLNSRPDLSPSRWAIDFGDRPEEEAAQFAAVWQIAERDIKPDRLSRDADKYPTMVGLWWRHWNPRRELYEAIDGQERALVVAKTSNTLAFAFLSTDILFSDAVYVFALDEWSDFCVMQSIFHDVWVRRHTSSLKGDVRYTAADAFETFPRPPKTDRAEEAGQMFYEARSRAMVADGVGMTSIHNRINDPLDTSPSTVALRALMTDLDDAVLEAYGFPELTIVRAFRKTGRGTRWTLDSHGETMLLNYLRELNSDRARAVAHGPVGAMG